MPNTEHFTIEQINQFLDQLNTHPGARLQYIGARYVPKFANQSEWDSAIEYEPLTIVQYQGNSYTSKQYVPIGIDIKNTDYWANTGNYNAQIEQYRQEVERFKEETEKRILFFPSVQEMKAYDFEVGWMAQTSGYRTPGIGSGLYLITSDAADGFTKIALDNGLTASLIYDSEINGDSVGAYGDGETDDSAYINAAIQACKRVKFSPKAYKVDQTITLADFSTLIGTLYETRLITDNNVIMMKTEYDHFKIEGIWFTATGDNNTAQAFYAERPYDGCVIRDCVFDNFGGITVKIGADTTQISQSFTMDNCIVYSNNSPTNCMLELNRAYECNILNTKFLFRGENANIPCVIANYVWDANFTGCSFLGTKCEGLRFTGDARYNRITNNTFEDIGSESGYSISCLINDHTDGTFSNNVIIFTNYYNAPKKIYIDKQYNAPANIVLNGSLINSYGNLSFTTGKGFIHDDTDNSPVFWVSGDASNELYLFCTRFILGNSNGALVMTDSEGNKWNGKISTEGTLTFSKLN